MPPPIENLLRTPYGTIAVRKRSSVRFATGMRNASTKMAATTAPPSVSFGWSAATAATVARQAYAPTKINHDDSKRSRDGFIAGGPGSLVVRARARRRLERAGRHRGGVRSDGDLRPDQRRPPVAAALHCTGDHRPPEAEQCSDEGGDDCRELRPRRCGA